MHLPAPSDITGPRFTEQSPFSPSRPPRQEITANAFDPRESKAIADGDGLFDSSSNVAKDNFNIF
jgi:hypothetical protein